MVKKSSKQLAFENYERSDKIMGSSDRAFGFVFTGFFVVVAIFKYWPQLINGYLWFITALFTLIIAFFCPKWLRPFNKLWLHFGLLLHRIVNPIVMGLLFFGVLTPMGLIARAFNWDPLRLKILPSAKSYWITREISQATDLKNQF